MMEANFQEVQNLIPPAGTAPSMIESEEIGTAGDIVASLTGWKPVHEYATLTTSCGKPIDKTEEFDPITKPAHYCQGDIEPLEFIEAQNLGFHEGNAVSYIARARHKGDEITDLRKAIQMLSRKVTLLERKP